MKDHNPGLAFSLKYIAVRCNITLRPLYKRLLGKKSLDSSYEVHHS